MYRGAVTQCLDHEVRGLNAFLTTVRCTLGVFSLYWGGQESPWQYWITLFICASQGQTLLRFVKSNHKRKPQEWRHLSNHCPDSAPLSSASPAWSWRFVSDCHTMRRSLELNRTRKGRSYCLIFICWLLESESESCSVMSDSLQPHGL